MSKETNLANALATTSTMLAEAITSRDQYMEWWAKKNAECDELRGKVTKLRSDLEFTEAELKNVRAALEAQKSMNSSETEEAPHEIVAAETEGVA